MLNKIKITLTLFLAISFTAYAQNVMLIPDVSGNAQDTIEIALEINNNDSFVAFQTDIELPSVVSYLNNSVALTSRTDGHMVTANIIIGNILRIIAFSIDQKEFIGTNGEVLKLKLILGAVPGNYSLSLQNPIISNQSSLNVLTSSSNGTLTLVSPDISSSFSSIDFGEIPLLQTMDKNITIYNSGNSPLNISRLYINNPYFEIIGDSTFTIQANSNRSVTIRFNSISKGSYTPTLIIQSNDPDESELSITLNAIAFAVNELHMQSASGRSGHEVVVTFSINNMEPVVGFQFDMIIPAQLIYVDGSETFSSRNVNHSISANMINSTRLRVVAISINNTPFLGVDGDILTISFLLDGVGGNYSVSLENVIISNAVGENITSAVYSSYVNIASPDISGLTSLNFGETSLLDTINYSYQLNNSGNDTLIITSFDASDTSFWNETYLPVQIAPGNNKQFSLKFYKKEKGTFTDKFVIRSNDPNEDPFNIYLSASSFAPNYISLPDTTFCNVGDTVKIQISVNNYEQFSALQFDIETNDSLKFIEDSETLSARASNHAIIASVVSENKVRVIAFSTSQELFVGNSGEVVELYYIVCDSVDTFDLTLSNGIISSVNGNNLIKDVESGKVTINVILPYTLQLTSNPQTGGAITGGGTYNDNSSVIITAIPNSGWKFINWTSGVSIISTDNPYTFNITQDTALVANFNLDSCEPANWTPVIYTNTTTAYGRVTIDNIIAEDGDIVGAFVNSECRAIGTVGVVDNVAYVTLVIQGEQPESVSFKVLDVSKCKILNVNYTIQTNPGNTIGLPPNYLPIDATSNIEQHIQLNEGWNLVSLNVAPNDNTPKAIFLSIIDLLTEVKEVASSYNPNVPIFLNTLKSMKDSLGYWVNVTQDTVIIVEGLPVDYATLQIQLNAGWNLIGYPLQKENNIENAVSSFVNEIIEVKNTRASFNPSVPSFLNTLKKMKPNEGYWMKVNSDLSFTYPTPILAKTKSATENNVAVYNEWQPVYYTNSMVYYTEIEIDNEPVVSGFVGAFINNECRGLGTIITEEGKSYSTIVVNGEEVADIEFRIVTEDEIVTINEMYEFTPNKTNTQIILLKGNTEAYLESLIPTITKLYYAYPNPFNPSTQLKFDLHKDSNVKISIYNIQGELVKLVTNNKYKAGTYNITWNGSNNFNRKVSSGVYIVNFRTDSKSFSNKILLVK